MHRGQPERWIKCLPVLWVRNTWQGFYLLGKAEPSAPLKCTAAPRAGRVWEVTVGKRVLAQREEFWLSGLRQVPFLLHGAGNFLAMDVKKKKKITLQGEGGKKKKSLGDAQGVTKWQPGR